MADSGQKYIKRNRPPRVHITYENPTNVEEKIELPFVMAVMTDLSGNAPGVEKDVVDKRKFLDVDMENFNARMRAIQPGVAFRTKNKLSDGDEQLPVKLRFDSMDDFRPAGIAKQVPALNKLLEARTQLSNLLRYMDGRADAEEQLRQLLSNKELMEALKDRSDKKSAPETPDPQA